MTTSRNEKSDNNIEKSDNNIKIKITNLTIDQKMELITRNTQESINIDECRKILETRNLKVYWGTATTGKPHIAYILPLMKIKDFIEAGCEVKILLADIHAFLDNLKANFNQIDIRTEYYRKLIELILKRLNITHNYEMIKGSSYQTKSNYSMDLLKLCSITTQRNAMKAGATVVKQVDNPYISSLIYPSMQALDEEYLGVDLQFGGVDQRKIFTYAMKYLPQIGYKKRSHLMNPMIIGLNGDKMSASDENSKIDFLDSRKTIRKKILKCFCEEGNVDNGLLPFLKYILMPFYQLVSEPIIIYRKNQESLIFKSYDDLHNSFLNKEIHPLDLKETIFEMIDFMIAPIRDEMLKNPELINKAYPK